MSRLNLLAGAAMAALVFTANGTAKAADMPVYYEPAPVFGGWYLRGDIGASHQVSDDLHSPRFDELAGLGDTVYLQESEWDPSWFIGMGFGYIINDRFRVDVTGEYRFKSDFDGFDTYDTDTDGDIDGSNRYDGDKEEAVFLVNAYWDITKWGTMTPFVGAGVGASWIRLSDFSDVDPVSLATGLSGDVESWNFAWALYAGLAFEINPQLTFEVGYRYLHLGDIETDDLLLPNGTNPVFNPFELDNIASHDVKIGLRYTFD
jgi:opacity protein-like surface antigen